MDPGLERLLQELRDDRSRGASELARRALEGLGEAALMLPAADSGELQTRLDRAARELQQVRPVMAPIANLVRQWRQGCSGLAGLTAAEARARAHALAADLSARSRRAVDSAAEAAAALVGRDRTLITHSMSSTVAAALQRLAPRVTVIVTESRPPGEGRQLASRLAQAGVPVHFISDAQMGLFARRADAALVGADALDARGALINKAGTYLLALAARDCGIPFYVCCEDFKRSTLTAADMALEEHPPQELDPPVAPGLQAHNVYFDVTPPRLIEAWITDRGVSHEFGMHTW